MSRSFLRELRRSARTLLARPGFTAAVVLMLALGVGANTAVFSAIEGLLLRPLPYPDSGRLVAIYNTYPKMGVEDAGTTVADYLDRREQADALADSAMYYPYSFDLADQGTPQRITGVVATPSLFTTLGVEPELGRAFRAEDAEPDGDRSVMWVPAQPVVLLSDALWRNSFAADPDVVGRELRLSGRSYRVIGVMPRGFVFPQRDVALWLPFAFSDRQKSDAMRGFEFGHSIGRLKPGATLAQLDAQFDVIAARHLARAAGAGAAEGADFWSRAASSGFTARARGLHARLLGDVGARLWLLQAAVALVLAIACANVANLMLIRLAARGRELAVRAALGASRRRIALQLVAESLLLVTAGGVLGIAVGYASIELIRLLGLDGAAQGFNIGLNLRVLGFAVAAVAITGFVCGLVPILSLRHGSSGEGLKEGGRGSVGGRSARTTRNALVVLQLGLAVALLVGGGLLAHSFWQMQRQDPGFATDGLTSVNLNLSRDRYREPAQTRRFQDELLAAVRALPGVESAGLISGLPFSDDNDSMPYFVEGRDQDEAASAYLQSVDEGLFATMGIALLQGRDFLSSDDENAAPVAIVDEELARKEFGARSPLGQRIGTRGVNGVDWRTIVGVVASVKRHRLTETSGRATYYQPNRQSTTRIFRLAIRSTLGADALAGPLRAAIAKLDPEQPIWDVLSMHERIDRSLAEQRTPMLLVVLFAAVALLLSCVGIHGVLAFAVAQRTGEIGVRMSLGASPGTILRMVLNEGCRLAAIGVLVGVPLALALGLQLRAQLFGVELLDPLTLGLVAAIVASVALLASLSPALRAAKASPMEALRYE
jgi:predicted permease